MSMSLNSMYTHSTLPSAPIFPRQTTYSPINSTCPTTSPSPYYHQIQPPPLEHSSHMTTKPSSQWSENRLAMFNHVSSFTPYQSTNGSIHSIVGMDEKIQKPIYQHGMPPLQTPTLPPPQNHQSIDISSASMVNRTQTRQLTNSKRAAQNRAAQRAFRQRKDRYIKDLEAKAKELESLRKQVEALQKDKVEMTSIIRNLRNENAKLKGEEVVDDDNNRHNVNNSGTGTHSNYSHYNQSRNDDDGQGLGDEPWSRNKDSVRKESLNRPGSGLTDNPPRGSGIVLPPGPNTDSSVEPFFRPDFSRHHANSNSPSPPSSASSDRNRGSYGASQTNGRGYSSNEEDTDRVYDDLCELLKTRSRPTLPQNLGRRIS